MGAATALYLTFAMMAQRIERPWLRRLVTSLCVLVPLLVGYARLYRGMHHLSDIVIGAVNGLVCMLLAWNYLRRNTSGAKVGSSRARRPRGADVRSRRRTVSSTAPIAGNLWGSRRSASVPVRGAVSLRLRRRRGGRARSSRRRRR